MSDWLEAAEAQGVDRMNDLFESRDLTSIFDESAAAIPEAANPFADTDFSSLDLLLLDYFSSIESTDGQSSVMTDLDQLYASLIDGPTDTPEPLDFAATSTTTSSTASSPLPNVPTTQTDPALDPPPPETTTLESPEAALPDAGTMAMAPPPTNTAPIYYGGLSDVVIAFSETPDNLAISIPLPPHFYDSEEDAYNLTYTAYVDDSSIASTEVDYYRNINIYSGWTTGITAVSVYATDSEGLYAYATFNVISVGVFGFTVEERTAAESDWHMPEDGNALWYQNEYRWTAAIEPSDALPLVQNVSWQCKPWESRNDDQVSWQGFGSASNADPQAHQLAVGHWAITPVVTIGHLSIRASVRQCISMYTITASQWAGVDPGDAETNLRPELHSDDWRFYPERNHPLNSVDANGNPIDQDHRYVDMSITIYPAPIGNSLPDVALEVFDPDHPLDGAQLNTPADGDRNDSIPGVHTPYDNMFSPGMSPAKPMIFFEQGEATKAVRLLVTHSYAGNDFIVGLHPNRSYVDEMRFRTDGQTLYVTERGGADQDVLLPFVTPRLTVWRTLWAELDHMAAPVPGPDGVFSLTDTLVDDLESAPPPPDITMLQMLMEEACIEVLEMPEKYNKHSEAPFVHNVDGHIAANAISSPIHDVNATPQSRDERFWTIQLLGAYEAESWNSWDPNGSGWRLGWCYRAGASFIYYETIRDLHANQQIAPYEGAPTHLPMAAKTTLERRAVVHETLHRFLGKHVSDDPTSEMASGVAEGVMDHETFLYGDVNANWITKHQIQRIQSNSAPWQDR